MFFILQKEYKEDYDLDIYIVKQILDKNRYTDEYTIADINEFESDVEYPKYMKEAIPVGSIKFVEKWLKRFHNIKCINPIEIPINLRKAEFLKRNYQILSKEKIPLSETFFFKDASALKYFSGIVNGERFFRKDIWNSFPKENDPTFYLNPNHLYQVSEVVDIWSEYRIYVQDNKVEAIANYNGDPTIMPDINIIKKMVLLYSMQNDCPMAYTLDVAINEKGTFLLEVHPWISVGLYNSLWSRKLLYAYRYGIDYVLKFNTKIEEFIVKK